MPTTRIYIVRDPEIDGAEELVEASSASAAMRHVATRRYTVKAATPKEVAELMQNGIRMQTAGEEATTA